MEKCFNPCFTGSLTATLPIVQQLQIHQVVSILVLLEVLLQPDYWLPLKEFVSVSILVLLEVLLQQLVNISKLRLEGCFNPCFTGSLTATFLHL